MEKGLKVINSVESSCGSCNTSGCGTCAPAPVKTASKTLLSRRDFGLAAFASACCHGSCQLLRAATASANHRKEQLPCGSRAGRVRPVAGTCSGAEFEGPRHDGA